MSPSDINWLSDSTQKEVARVLTEGRKCMADLADCKELLNSKKFQIGKQSDRINGFMARVEILKEQKSTLQAEVIKCDGQINVRDKQILKLKTTQWLIIGVSGAAIIGTIVIAATL